MSNTYSGYKVLTQKQVDKLTDKELQVYILNEAKKNLKGFICWSIRDYESAYTEKYNTAVCWKVRVVINKSTKYIQDCIDPKGYFCSYSTWVAFNYPELYNKAKNENNLKEKLHQGRIAWIDYMVQEIKSDRLSFI